MSRYKNFSRDRNSPENLKKKKDLSLNFNKLKDDSKEFKRGVYDREKSDILKVDSTEGEGIRLNKYISNSGICSRRQADNYIRIGSVTVNGKVITQMGYRVMSIDKVKFDGVLVLPEKKRYIILNKPKNYITTMDDNRSGRKTVMDLVANATKERIYPVGRLDRASTGVLLFTNDGELAKRLTHPKHKINKIYHVTLDRKLAVSDLHKIAQGCTIDKVFVSVDEISYVQGATKTEVGIRIHSGRNRIVRRIFEHFKYNVIKLDRVVFAELTKKDLPRGRWRHLTNQEVINLKYLSKLH